MFSVYPEAQVRSDEAAAEQRRNHQLVALGRGKELRHDASVVFSRSFPGDRMWRHTKTKTKTFFFLVKLSNSNVICHLNCR